jgi:hypothetical protein
LGILASAAEAALKNAIDRGGKPLRHPKARAVRTRAKELLIQKWGLWRA